MRFQVLDAWRGLAALFVVLYHFAWFFGVFLGNFVWDSYLFVDFFFVLSGFVIAFTYLDRVRAPGERLRFVVRRFGRVWPSHFFTMLVVIGVLFAARRPPDLSLWTGQGINPILTNTFLVHSFGLHPTLTLNVPSWSIAVEFATYLVFLLLAVLLPRAMPWTAAALIVASMVILAVFAGRFMDVHNDLGVFRCFAGFFTGYFLFLLWRQLGGRAYGGTLAEVAVVAVMAWFVTIAGNGVSPVSLAAPFVFAPVVFVFAAEAGWLSAILRLRPFQWLGDVSYSLYMAHFAVVLGFPPLMQWLSFATGLQLRPSSLRMDPYGHPVRLASIMALYLALVLAATMVTYFLVERPGRRWFNRVAQRIGRREPAVGAVTG